MGSGILCCLPDPVDFDADVNLFHFELHRAIGKGAFGKVRVVEHKRTKKVYALKYIDKARCVKQRAVANIIQERQLLEEVDHPFIVNLRYAFQDDANCFFALDLMLGGDLRFHLERKGSIEENSVRFWVAELSSALSYLHKQRIVHRDIKPDNILLDIMGHAHITDFNVAIHYSASRQHTSVAGSLAYMAPEVCGRKGYSWQADWWSLGVCAYELIFGRRPFEGRTSSELTSSILKDHLRFPDRAPSVCSQEGLNALQQFLDRSPKKRLGCRQDAENLDGVRTHPWFSSLNWESILVKDAQPPFVPDMRKANFDISHELDEFLMVEKPLTATKRKQNVDLDKLGPEYRQLEEQFTNFDFTKPRRMSYYPHNQPHMHAGEVDADGEPSFDIPRSSVQTRSDSRKSTTSQNGATDMDPSAYVHHDAADVRNSADPGSPRQQEYGVAISTPSTPPAGVPIPQMPAPPDAVYMRGPSIGNDPAAVQPLPRLSSGSKRS